MPLPPVMLHLFHPSRLLLRTTLLQQVHFFHLLTSHSSGRCESRQRNLPVAVQQPPIAVLSREMPVLVEYLFSRHLYFLAKYHLGRNLWDLLGMGLQVPGVELVLRILPCIAPTQCFHQNNGTVSLCLRQLSITRLLRAPSISDLEVK